MGRIIELSPHVANQIAAGEVVERPLSVVKELLENALDAGAQNIEVRIKDGGLSYLVVQDDGFGMDESDVELATKRYATSKLCDADDLCSITSFGFRGEALASIASIAHLTIISRPTSSQHGAKIVVAGGELLEKSRAGSALGTRVEVRDLFYNVPARLKFVKSQRAENSSIDKLLRAYAYVHPHIAFNFFCDEKLAFSSPADSTMLMRAQALLGPDTKGMLHELDAKSELIHLQGAIAAPMITRRDSRGIIFFVNKRLVSDKKLSGALKASFRTLLEVGRSPIGAVSLTLNAEEVDVNVHPRKSEVRFVNERRVLSHMISLMSSFLSKTPWLSRTDTPAFTSLPGLAPMPINTPQAWPAPASRFVGGAHDFLLSLPKSESSTPKTSETLLPTAQFSELRVIGQVHTTYLLLESHEGLVVIDQHAAHERINFERIRARRNVELISRSLLIPLSFDLSLADLALALEFKEEFEKLGIELEAFGEHTLVVRAIPDFVEQENTEALIHDILAELAEHGRCDTLNQMHDNLCATIACHSSIRAGQRLSNDEIAALLFELDNIDFGAHCPHGRPVVKSFCGDEMKKWFHRT